jgi:hypothetical protein
MIGSKMIGEGNPVRDLAKELIRPRSPKRYSILTD